MIKKGDHERKVGRDERIGGRRREKMRLDERREKKKGREGRKEKERMGERRENRRGKKAKEKMEK